MLEVKGEVEVFVGMYQGIVDRVEVFVDEGAALDAFRDYTGIIWPEYLRQSKAKDCGTILGDHAGTSLYIAKLESVDVGSVL